MSFDLPVYKCNQNKWMWLHRVLTAKREKTTINLVFYLNKLLLYKECNYGEQWICTMLGLIPKIGENGGKKKLNQV